MADATGNERGPGGRFLPKSDDPETASSSSSSPPPSESASTSPPSSSPADKPPRRRPGRPKGAKNKRPRAGTRATITRPSTKEIADVLSELLTAPAVPYTVFGFDWPAQHVIRTGPELAAQLAAFSEHNSWLRSKLEALARGENVLGTLVVAFGLTTITAQYVVPQLSYFGVLPTSAAASVGAEVPPGGAEQQLRSQRAAQTPHHPADDVGVSGTAPPPQSRAA